MHDLCHLFKGFIDVLLFKTMGFVLMDVRVGLKHFSGVGQHPSKGRSFYSEIPKIAFE